MSGQGAFITPQEVTDELIERLAQVVYRHTKRRDTTFPEWDGVKPPWKNYYRAEARAVVNELTRSVA